MPKYKPTRTEDNLPSRSSPIRKGTMKEEEIKAVAQELTKSSFVDDLMEAKATIEKGLQELQSPAIEPVAKGDYKVYAETIKAICEKQQTVEVTIKDLKKLFPQNKDVSDIVRNLKRGHGINYRRLDNGNYLLFVEPTKEELIVQLTSAENRVIELEKTYKEQINKDLKEINLLNGNIKKIKEEKTELSIKNYQLTEENTQLKSDLNNSQKTNKILFWLAILAFITIIIKSVAL